MMSQTGVCERVGGIFSPFVYALKIWREYSIIKIAHENYIRNKMIKDE